jgi:hypothetical protein
VQNRYRVIVQFTGRTNEILLSKMILQMFIAQNQSIINSRCHRNNQKMKFFGVFPRISFARTGVGLGQV